MKRYGYQVGYESMHVDGRFEILLADNDGQGDERVCLKAAPAITGDGLVACYITTNGDPVLVCTIGQNNGVVWYLGEDEPEDTEGITIATCLEGFNDFVGRTPAECAEWCEVLFEAKIEK